jgi:hypothetical protein
MSFTSLSVMLTCVLALAFVTAASRAEDVSATD